MPELPDVEAYVAALDRVLAGQRLARVRVFGPSILKSVEPPLSAFEGLAFERAERLGKRIALGFEGGRYLVIHLMIAGRLLWRAGPPAPGQPGGRTTAACLEFDTGHLLLTEAGTKKRANLTALAGREGLEAHRRGGIEPMTCDLESFREALLRENRTLKRAMTNPEAFSGIGNAFSDEILHAARLSPMRLTRSLDASEVERLFLATREVLGTWTERLIQKAIKKFPGRDEVTAFRPEFAVHGKFGEPCPVCGRKVQRIRYADNETNYCAICQNEGRLLADRSLSRLLKDDWPKMLEDE